MGRFLLCTDWIMIFFIWIAYNVTMYRTVNLDEIISFSKAKGSLIPYGRKKVFYWIWKINFSWKSSWSQKKEEKIGFVVWNMYRTRESLNVCVYVCLCIQEGDRVVWKGTTISICHRHNKHTYTIFVFFRFHFGANITNHTIVMQVLLLYRSK